MTGIKVIATNRKATHEYQIEERYEAGIVLTGTEIKSVRASQVSLQEGYVQEQDGELWLVNVHIARYEPAGRLNHDPLRPRKLLLHRREINRIIGRMRERGVHRRPAADVLEERSGQSGNRPGSGQAQVR
jgi:SsrA-binding protein